MSLILNIVVVVNVMSPALFAMHKSVNVMFL